MLTVPLQHASQNQLICDIALSDDAVWRNKIVKSIQQAYARSSQFKHVFPLVERIVHHPAKNLADYLLHSLTCLRDHLGLTTDIVATSRRYENAELRAQARIVDICLREKADLYINSIGGIELYERALFEQQGLKVCVSETRWGHFAAARCRRFFVVRRRKRASDLRCRRRRSRRSWHLA